MSPKSVASGAEFDGVCVGRPAAAALERAGLVTLADLPGDLDSLLEMHGVGPKAVLVLREARASESAPRNRGRCDP